MEYQRKIEKRVHWISTQSNAKENPFLLKNNWSFSGFPQKCSPFFKTQCHFLTMSKMIQSKLKRQKSRRWVGSSFSKRETIVYVEIDLMSWNFRIVTASLHDAELLLCCPYLNHPSTKTSSSSSSRKWTAANPIICHDLTQNRAKVLQRVKSSQESSFFIEPYLVDDKTATTFDVLGFLKMESLLSFWNTKVQVRNKQD